MALEGADLGRVERGAGLAREGGADDVFVRREIAIGWRDRRVGRGFQVDHAFERPVEAEQPGIGVERVEHALEGVDLGRHWSHSSGLPARIAAREGVVGARSFYAVCRQSST